MTRYFAVCYCYCDYDCCRCCYYCLSFLLTLYSKRASKKVWVWASVNVCVRLVRAHIVFILKLNWIRDIWKKHFFPYSSFGYIVLEKSKATLKNPQVMISSIWSSVNSFHCMYIYLLASHTYERLFKSLSKYIRREKEWKREKWRESGWAGARASERRPHLPSISIRRSLKTMKFKAEIIKARLQFFLLSLR